MELIISGPLLLVEHHKLLLLDLTFALVVTLNMLAEEIQDSIIHQGYVNRDATTLDIVQMSFILDDKDVVKMVNQQAYEILSLSKGDIIDKTFESLLEDASAERWNKALKN